MESLNYNFRVTIKELSRFDYLKVGAHSIGEMADMKRGAVPG